MSVIDDGATAADKEPTVKKKTTRRTPRAGHRRRRFTVPNRVEPSWIHNLLAGVTLRALNDAGADTGEVDDDLVKLIPGAEDAPEPAELLARVYAHVMWRIPIVRGVAKRLEGTETKSGLWSDLLALAISLWFRNRDLLNAFRDTQRRNIADQPTRVKFDWTNFRTRKDASTDPAEAGERGASQ